MDTQQEIEALKARVTELTNLLSKVITPSGEIRATQVSILPKDTSVTAASGSVRIETNLGPINVLIT